MVLATIVSASTHDAPFHFTPTRTRTHYSLKGCAYRKCTHVLTICERDTTHASHGQSHRVLVPEIYFIAVLNAVCVCMCACACVRVLGPILRLCAFWKSASFDRCPPYRRVEFWAPPFGSRHQQTDCQKCISTYSWLLIYVHKCLPYRVCDRSRNK